MSGAADGSRAGFETARLKLARLRIEAEDARQSAVRQLARISTDALGTERTGVWLLDDASRRLRNLGNYRRSSDTFSAGEVVEGAQVPGFLAVLNERRVLAIADMRGHRLGAQLSGSPLALAETASRLDAPIIRDGRLAGVVCHEQVGEARIWSQKDRDFAASTADMAALFLEQADRLEIEVALRQRREEKLEDEKMDALGRLARSVAHDMNNVFNILLMAGAMLETRPDDDLRQQGDSIRRAVGVGARLVQQLTLFGAETTDSRTRVDLAFLVERMRPVLIDLARDARLEIAVRCAPPVINASPSHIEQVVLNLCVNAAEAISKGGLIRIELRDPRPDETLDPSSLVLSVEDDGRGMDAETQAHVFEPYFTRKEGGHGIGLSVVYGIVKRYRGSIAVRSEPGAGATFTIVWPRALDPQPLR